MSDKPKGPKSIDPTQAREKVRSGRAMLVCGYEDDEKCRKLMLQGAVSFSDFQSVVDRIPKDEEIIFFCT